jgi:hypothetical protein
MSGAVESGGDNMEQDLVSGIILGWRKANDASHGSYIYTVEYGVDIFRAAVTSCRRTSVERIRTRVALNPNSVAALKEENIVKQTTLFAQNNKKEWVPYYELSRSEQHNAKVLKVNNKELNANSICIEENVVSERVFKQNLLVFKGDYKFCCVFNGEPAYRIVSSPKDKATEITRSWESKHRFLFWVSTAQMQENLGSTSMGNRWYIGDELGNADVAIMRTERMPCACGNIANSVKCSTKHAKLTHLQKHNGKMGKFVLMKDAVSALNHKKIYAVQLDDTNETIEIQGKYLKPEKRKLKPENGQCCECDKRGEEMGKGVACLVFDPNTGKKMHDKAAWRQGKIDNCCSGGMYNVVVDSGN